MSWPQARLAVGVRAHEALELPDELRMLAQRELRIRSFLHGKESELVEAYRFGPGELLGCELLEGCAAPEVEGFVEQWEGLVRRPPAVCLLRVRGQDREAPRVVAGRVGVQHVPRRAGRHDLIA